MERFTQLLTTRKQNIANHFSRCIPTYESGGKVQRSIAEELVQMLEPIECGTVLEIGCGTGLLSGLLRARLPYCHLVCNDLSPDMETPLREKVGDNALFLPGDAEVIDWPGECDVVASASCIQWWEDPLAFFPKAYKTLADGGQLLFSTFLPGNLQELTAVTGAGLRYPSHRAIERAMEETGFEEIRLIEQRRTLHFPTLIRLLSHLRDTGTNSLSSGGLWTPLRLVELERSYRHNLHLPPEAPLPLTYVGLRGSGWRKRK